MFRIFLRLTFDSFRLRRLFPFVSDKPRNRETSKDLPPFLNRMWVKISFDSEFIAGKPIHQGVTLSPMRVCLVAPRCALEILEKIAMCLYKTRLLLQHSWCWCWIGKQLCSLVFFVSFVGFIHPTHVSKVWKTVVASMSQFQIGEAGLWEAEFDVH